MLSSSPSARTVSSPLRVWNPTLSTPGSTNLVMIWAAARVAWPHRSIKFTEKYGLKLKLEESGEKKRKKLISFSSSEEDDMEDGELTPEADE